ncbi:MULTISPECIES: DUF2599 domain-containing protein [unclassified Pseudomonas]|uniref:DUF2599 domain-containing protein n=1 Tax=unclassified Pseudomonas TaxID=196821 RepID=UPI0021C6EC31|nr:MULTISPECIES: DUF2599 domain-containing protein [unclassified Pseudomonas]MCU1730895.1 DUF2599 domain-containing protein [Pseudomonas sp. 20P_3.2_Bac4]MCU1747680.1 DUF2599 domain-containing protein [Pseudomonas sp. 20P_3.2_Bac5]
MRASSILFVLSTLGVSLWVQAQETDPQWSPQATVERINRNYNTLENACKEVGSGAPRGHYYCSGVTLRMVNDGPFNPWDYSPYAVKTGATSWTWLRRDLSINTLVHPAGMIMRNPVDAQQLGAAVKQEGFVCVYPFDAGTGPDRKWHGCGQYGKAQPVTAGQGGAANLNATTAYGTCPEQGVNNLTEWQKAYGNTTVQRVQCSFNADDPAQWDEMIQIHESRAKANNTAPLAVRTLTNEFMMRNASESSDGSDTTKYIDAFVYNPNSNFNYSTYGDTKPQKPEDGLTSARNFQKKLAAAGFTVPILRVDFTKPASERFGYIESDQAIALQTVPADAPGKYIESSQWSIYIDAATKREEWSLKVIPTSYGRNVGEKETEALYQELLARHGNDPQWRDNEQQVGSMRRQLVCLLVNYRQKPEWYIEPSRPYVSHAVATKAGCNPR